MAITNSWQSKFYANPKHIIMQSKAYESQCV